MQQLQTQTTKEEEDNWLYPPILHICFIYGAWHHLSISVYSQCSVTFYIASLILPAAVCSVTPAGTCIG